MTFADLDLSRRLERAEGCSCLEFAEARGRLHPESGATWMECAGAYAVFDGVNSPVTQSFGLGLFEPLSPAALDRMEAFFLDRGAVVVHEVSPLAGIATLDLLCTRGYRPIELSSVLQRPVERPAAKTPPDGITVRVAGVEEAALWVQINARGWGHEHPELADFLGEFGSVGFAREHTVNFFAELDGQPGAAGALSLYEGVASVCRGGDDPGDAPARTAGSSARGPDALRLRTWLRTSHDGDRGGEPVAAQCGTQRLSHCVYPHQVAAVSVLMQT